MSTQDVYIVRSSVMTAEFTIIAQIALMSYHAIRESSDLSTLIWIKSWRTCKEGKMAKRTIKEGEPMDPIQVGDIITLELKDGSVISDLLAVPADDYDCDTCYMSHNRKRHACRCFEGWVIKNPDRYGSGLYTDVALCCTEPVFTKNSTDIPKFCRFIQLDTIMEDL
jgi:hypothetical protein